jgi:hypothetical protein
MAPDKPPIPSDQALLDSLPQTQYGTQQSWSNGKYRFEMLPEGYIALNKELATGLHPKLEASFVRTELPIEDVDMRLSLICAYCGVLLDGTYTLEERDKLCFVLAGRLEALREAPAGIILSS